MTPNPRKITPEELGTKGSYEYCARASGTEWADMMAGQP